jgi:hypothetical protein
LLIDPIESWYLRNTGRTLTPYGGVSGDAAPKPVPFGASRLEEPPPPPKRTVTTLYPGARVRDPLEPTTFIGPRTYEEPKEDNPILKNRGEQVARERMEAQERRNKQTAALNDLRRERLNRIEQARVSSAAQAAARANQRIRQVQEQQRRVQQQRYRLSTSRSGSAIPLQPEQYEQARKDVMTSRPGTFPAALAPPWWPKGNVAAPFTSGMRVGPSVAVGRSTLRRDADGSRDGGQYYALAPRSYVAWSAPKYLENDQFTFGLGKTDAEMRRLQVKLLERGFFSTQGQIAYNPGQMDGFTREAIELAMRVANEDGRTLEELLAAPSRYNADGSAYGSGGGGGGGGPRTIKDVQRIFDITSLDRGSATLRQIMARELGRQPTAAEIKNYVAQLNARERANPDIVTTTSTRNASGSYTTSTQIREGKRPEPEEQAIGYTKAGEVGKERQEFQEARYYEELVDLIGGEGSA